jgi:hypothetical protein
MLIDSLILKPAVVGFFLDVATSLASGKRPYKKK